MSVLLDAIETAVHDGRTGALTSDAWRSRADGVLSTACGERIGLLLLDIDHFKAWNDRWGHPAGDILLAEVGWAVRCEVRHVDLVGRLGGDELVVLLVGDHDEVSVVAVAERVRRRVAGLSIGRGDVSVSVGAALLTAGAVSTVDDLVAAADRAAYRAKSAGRNTVRLEGAFAISGSCPNRPRHAR